MGNAVPRRMWLPLFIIHEINPFYTKTKLQKVTFLAQYAAKLDLYDFKTHHYGPYSQMLNVDTICYNSLISYSVNDTVDTNRRYFVFKLTQKGEQAYSNLSRNISEEIKEKVRYSIERYANMTTRQLLEEVYSRFAIKKSDSRGLWQKVMAELDAFSSPLQQFYNDRKIRQAFFLLSVIEITKASLESLRGIRDTTKRGVVLNLAQEITHKCKEVLNDVAVPSPNSEALQPRFVEIGELESFLREYCETKDIVDDPLKLPLEDVMNEDEAKRVATALTKIQLPI